MKEQEGKLKVSIITPSYNSSEFIVETIRSVLNQKHENWEMIITDDASDDNSVSIIEAFSEKDKRIKLIKLDSNSGSGVARNTSIKAATGDVIAFLDSDDTWDDTFLSESLSFMERKQAAMVYSSYRRKSEDLSICLGVFNVPESVSYNDMLKTCAISCLTGMYHVERCGGKMYMPKIRKRQDYCLWLSLLKKNKHAYGLPDVLATYRVRNSSVSRNKAKAASYQWYVYRNIEKLSWLSAAYYFCHYSVKGFKKNLALL